MLLRRCILLLVIAILLGLRGSDVYAQGKEGITVRGFFLQDSLRLGVEVEYALVVRYPANRQILLPDSGYQFHPFEWRKQTAVPTRTQRGVSTDSVVYRLVSFDISAQQYLALPVFVQTVRDCTRAYYAAPDSITLLQLVKTNPENTPLQENTRYMPVQERFNYPYWLAGGGAVVMVLGLVWILLGGQISQTYYTLQLRTRQAVFLKDYSRLVNRVISRAAIEEVEKAVALWKKHLEYIENKPFSTYTSREISEELPETTLATALRQLDQAIYGKVFSTETTQALMVLREVSISRYGQRREKLRLQR